MRLSTILLLLTLQLSVQAQNSCQFYSKYIILGDQELVKAEFERAINAYSIALLHCPDSAEEARARILVAFEAINSLKNIAETEQKRAENASRIAEIAREQAMESAKRADSSAHEAQKNAEEAEEQRGKADILSRNTMALNLALQTELEESYPDKVSLALRAYYLNKVYHNNDWSATIVNAFWLSDSASYGKQITNSVPSAILDFKYIPDHIIAITDGGELISIDSLGQWALLSNGDQYFYRRNSLQYDRSNQMLEFQNQSGEVIRFRKQDTGWHKEENAKANPPNIVPVGSDTLIFNQRSIINQKDGSSVISFNRGQTTATYAISSDNTYLAVGTQDGWLYVYNLSASENHFRGPYHVAGSRISDIAFTDDNQFIGTSGLDGRITINKTDSLGSKRPAEIVLNGWVNCIEFLPEKRIMVGTQDGDIIQYLYDQDKLSVCACDNPNFPETVPWVDHGTADTLMITECEKIIIDEKHSP